MSKPDTVSTLTSCVTVANAKTTIEAYKEILGAEVMGILEDPNSGAVLHACLKIGESTLFLFDPCPKGETPISTDQRFYLYVDNVDEAHAKAINAGWKQDSQPADMDWGERCGSVVDPDGFTWMFAQFIREVSFEEVQASLEK